LALAHWVGLWLALNLLALLVAQSLAAWAHWAAHYSD
jgi:hypothetical protein